LTTEDAVAIVALTLPGPESPAKLARAQAVLEMAIKSLSAIGNFEWNRQQFLITLTANIATYTAGDLFQGAQVTALMGMLWFADAAYYAKQVKYSEFEEKARGKTETGRPRIITMHSARPVVEVYPIPEQTYTGRIMVGFIPSMIEDLPTLDYVAIDKAKMLALPADNPVYPACLANWQEAKQNIRDNDGYIKDDSRLVEGDSWGIGGDGRGRLNQGRAASSLNLDGR
jgi:hypothetical protein